MASTRLWRWLRRAIGRSVASTSRPRRSVTLPNPVMTASGTAGHGAELAAYLDLAGARRRRGEVAVGRAVARQPGAAGARDARRRDAQQRRAPGAGRRGLARATTCRRCGAPAPGSSRRSGVGPSTTTRRRAELLPAPARRVVAVEVNLSCPNLDGGPSPVRPGRRRQRGRRARARRRARSPAAGVGEADAPTSPTRRGRGGGRRRRAPRPSRSSTRCSGMAIDADDAPLPARQRRRWRRPVRARPSTRSRSGPCTTSTPRCPTCRSSGVGGVRTRRGRRRAAARRRVGGAGRHGDLRRPRAPAGECCDELDDWCDEPRRRSPSTDLTRSRAWER